MDRSASDTLYEAEALAVLSPPRGIEEEDEPGLSPSIPIEFDGQ